MLPTPRQDSGSEMTTPSLPGRHQGAPCGSLARRVGGTGLGCRRHRHLRDPATRPHSWPSPSVGGRHPSCPHSNDYDYVMADPIGNLDLDGRACLFGKEKGRKGCRGGSVAKNSWVQTGVSLAACSTGVACGPVLAGFVAYNGYNRGQKYGYGSSEFAKGTAMDIFLARLPMKPVRGTPKRFRGTTPGGTHHAIRVANYQKFHPRRSFVAARNLAFAGASMGRAYAFPEY